MKYVPETPIGSPPAATVQPNHTMDDVLDDDVVAALRNAIQKPSKKTSRSRSTKQMETVAETPSREGRIAPPRRARNTIVSNLLGKYRNNAIPPRSSNRIKSKNVDNTIPPRSKKSKSKLQSKIKPKKRAPPPRIATVSNNNDGSGSEEEWTATPSPKKSLSISTGPIVPVRDGASTRSRKTVALYTFDAQNEDELDFQEGDDVLVLKELDQGWSDGMNLRTKKRGIFPTSYVDK